MLLSEGHIIYHGPTADVVSYFERLGFHRPLDVSMQEWVQELTGPVDQEVGVFCVFLGCCSGCVGCLTQEGVHFLRMSHCDCLTTRKHDLYTPQKYWKPADGSAWTYLDGAALTNTFAASKLGLAIANAPPPPSLDSFDKNNPAHLFMQAIVDENTYAAVQSGNERQ